jgi:hypothetical protein
MNLNPAVQKPRMTGMTRMGTGFVMVENLFRGQPPGEHPWHRNPFLSVLSAKSVVPTAVFGLKELFALPLPPLVCLKIARKVREPCPAFRSLRLLEQLRGAGAQRAAKIGQL